MSTLKKFLNIWTSFKLKYSAITPLHTRRVSITLEQKGFVENNVKFPKIPLLLTISISMCVFWIRKSCSKTQKAPLLWAFGTKSGRQNATLQICNYFRPIRIQRNDVTREKATMFGDFKNVNNESFFFKNWHWKLKISFKSMKLST